MDIVFVLKTIAGLVSILALLILFFFYPSKKEKKKKISKKVKPKEKIYTLEEILAVVRDKSSSKEELYKVIDSLVKYHAKIPHKLGMRAHPDFDIYEELVLRLCHHPNTDKDLILRVDKVLQKENPTYKVELNDALTKGLNARGV